jgi:hypothetical protein
VRTALYAQARERWDCFAFMLIEATSPGIAGPDITIPARPDIAPALRKNCAVAQGFMARSMTAGPGDGRRPRGGGADFSDHGFGGATRRFSKPFLEQQGC